MFEFCEVNLSTLSEFGITDVNVLVDVNYSQGL